MSENKFEVVFVYDDYCGEACQHRETFSTYEGAKRCIDRNWDSDWRYSNIISNGDVVFHVAKKR